MNLKWQDFLSPKPCSIAGLPRLYCTTSKCIHILLKLHCRSNIRQLICWKWREITYNTHTSFLIQRAKIKIWLMLSQSRDYTYTSQQDERLTAVSGAVSWRSSAECCWYGSKHCRLHIMKEIGSYKQNPLKMFLCFSSAAQNSSG